MIRTFFIFIALFIAIGLLASSYSVYINPAEFVWPAFLGLGFPFLLIVNLIMIFILAFSSQKVWMIIPITALIFSWKNVTSTLNFSIPKSKEGEIKLITWNVKNFDLYNWTNNLETSEKMMELIIEQNPDILCLQEFYTDVRKHKNLENILKSLGYKYFHFEPVLTLDNQRRKWGLITFSKFPITNKGSILFNDGSRLNTCVYTDIQLENEVVRIYNMHLQSIQFDEDDYEYLENVSQKPYPNIAPSRLLTKVKIAFEKRANQALKVAEHKNNFEGKSILCGDFNDSSVSFAYNTLSKNMVDAFSEKGFLFGKTFANPTPFLKIDHVLLDKSFIVNNHTIINKPYSDHFPVIVTFSNNN